MVGESRFRGTKLGMVSRCIHVIGIGAGDPDYLTVQAIEALNSTDVFFLSDKGEAKHDLVALRREICSRFIRDRSYRFVELPDPERSADLSRRVPPLAVRAVGRAHRRRRDRHGCD